MSVYPYRTTLDKIGAAFHHIESSGDVVEFCVHVGGRDWVLIARGGDRG